MGLLLETARQLPNINFKIAGMPSKQIDNETARAVEQLKELVNVKFIGYVSRKDVLEFLAGAVALLSTSHYEGFSNTFLEALFSGTPVLAPLRVDPDHIITRNKLGFTCENDNELSQQIERAWNLTTDDYTSLAYKCRSYVVEHHDPVVKAKELVDILTLIIEKNK